MRWPFSNIKLHILGGHASPPHQEKFVVDPTNTRTVCRTCIGHFAGKSVSTFSTHYPEVAGDLILRIRHFISGVTDHLRTRLIIDEKVLWKVFHALVLRGSSLGPPRGKVLTPDTIVRGRF